MSKSREVLLKINTTGGAGVSAGSVTSEPITGFIEDVFIDYNGSAPTTTDLTITENGGLGRTLFTFTNNKTDKTFSPRVLKQDATGADITGVYGRIFLAGGTLTAALAQCDDLSPAVTIHITISEN
jgi:hypothetical protein